MKKILVIIDGMEDIAYEELNGLTPFQYADCQYIEKMETVTKVMNTPVGMEADSLTCILHLLGVAKDQFPDGRAYIEAKANHIRIDPDDLVLRCNTVTIKEGKLVSSCKVTEELMYTKYPIYPIGQYRSLMVVDGGRKYFNSLKTFQPHQNLGKNIEQLLPYGNRLGNELSAAMLEMLHKHKNITFLPWSPSIPSCLPQFQELHFCKGAMVCYADVVRGIAALMGMVCPEVKGATGDIDTNLEGKTREALKLLNEFDFVVLHINGADEASHRKDPLSKAAFIAKVDHIVIRTLCKKNLKNCEIIVTSDHATIAKTGKHDAMEVTCWKSHQQKK